ncbi:MAG: RnfABCDGE type electron transport complex subunit A [Chloroflexota bacterium]
MSNLIAIFISMAIINNFIVARFLGLCPFFGVSKKLQEAMSMGFAVILVMLIASVVTWIITNYVLIPFDAQYMDIIMYILVIASLVQMIELFIKRTNLTLYNALGIYLPLITTNCAVLGITLINAKESYTLLESTVAALGGGMGFLLILIIMSGIREKLEIADLPRSMKGLPIAMLVGMMLGLTFFGFGGMV